MRVMDIIKAMVAKEASGWSIGWAIVLILLGVAAIASPVVTTLAAVVVIGWIVILSGIAHLFSAFGSGGIGRALWAVFVGVVYLAVGIAIQSHPLWGVATLTWMILTVFVAEGGLALAAFVESEGGCSGWTLVNGIITLMLGAMIWSQWPSSSMWVIGTLVGANLIFTGAIRLFLSLTAREIQSSILVA
jgi:uncharacterized membrane protein HdeD (DUF308 family)